MIHRGPTLARQAAMEVISAIRAGELAADDGLLPSETLLSRRLGVSRATLREALSQLERGGLIVRRHGVGTFVTSRQPPMEWGLEELESIETHARRTGVEIRMGACTIRERAAATREAECLDLPAGATVIAVERVMLMRDAPVAYLVDVVPGDLLSLAELGASFNGSVLDVFLQRGRPELGHSSTELSAKAADRDLAERLAGQIGDPVLTLTAQLFATNGRVVDYSLSCFSPGFFRFFVIRRVTPLSMTPAGAGSVSREPAGAHPAGRTEAGRTEVAASPRQAPKSRLAESSAP
jgi:GntR family transcriptional regulator